MEKKKSLLCTTYRGKKESESRSKRENVDWAISMHILQCIGNGMPASQCRRKERGALSGTETISCPNECAVLWTPAVKIFATTQSRMYTYMYRLWKCISYNASTHRAFLFCHLPGLAISSHKFCTFIEIKNVNKNHRQHTNAIPHIRHVRTEQRVLVLLVRTHSVHISCLVSRLERRANRPDRLGHSRLRLVKFIAIGLSAISSPQRMRLACFFCDDSTSGGALARSVAGAWCTY